MFNYKKLAAASILTLVGVAGCHGDFLTGGELSNDPNRPVVASKTQLFQGIESEIWSLLGSDPSRTTSILSQQQAGRQSQYGALQATYSVDANLTNGFQSSIYTGGGLVDIVKLEQASKAANDSIFLGISEVQEALLMGTAADLFGDIVYSQALQNIPNPKLDPQLSVYDSVQKVLDAAIANLATHQSKAAFGPGANDLVYGGNPASWAALAHTLKARFYLHTGEVRPTTAYAAALAEAQKGIQTDAGNYVGAFTAASGEQNFYYQLVFTTGRGGYITPNEYLDSLLEARNDPRRTQYFDIDAAADTADGYSAARLDPAFPQPFVTADENTLIIAESAYRTGDFALALSALNAERVKNGLPVESAANSAGLPLLNEILIEEYITDFELGEESLQLYNRTCTPNLVPTAPGKKIPGRLMYDTSELNTDTNYPAPGTGSNGLRNADDPPNTTSDGTGAACIGQ